ncbi:SGNH/GDSL hydrolase family protein [Pedobacter nyackensis]|uniref:SGNH/GDSL hydrolase family protein n=1 Tax=Pedobacter nyackensis TaxID=475255 RepID=UPI002930D771|nr:SGNH/GDSL hydrolase family protein [Pedobacter nyackensis]
MNDPKTPPAINPGHKITYLALGDSYTIGESLPVENNFPSLLTASLRTEGLDVAAPNIIATTGWTTSELQAAIKKEALTQKFGLVTLLIGVNNQYRGESLITYRKEFKELLQTALDFADGNKNHVFVLSIPDWGVTPYGAGSGRDQQNISNEINAFNLINKEETLALGLSYTDITPGSRKVASGLDLVASDGLHYSAKMHAEWVASLKPAVMKVLK